MGELSSNQLQVEVRDGTLYCAWNNRTMRKDTFTLVFLILFWIVWAPITVFLTWKLLRGFDLFLCFWLVFGWGGTLLIPNVILGRYWTEWLAVSSEKISFGSTGFLARKPKHVPLANVLEITYGYCDDSADRESMATLNIYDASQPWSGGRRLLAYWLAPHHKEQLFQEIKSFAEQRKLPLHFRRYQ